MQKANSLRGAGKDTSPQSPNKAAARFDAASITPFPETERNGLNWRGISSNKLFVRSGVAAVVLSAIGVVVNNVNTISQAASRFAANVSDKLHNGSEPLTVNHFFSSLEEREAQKVEEERENKRQELEKYAKYLTAILNSTQGLIHAIEDFRMSENEDPEVRKVYYAEILMKESHVFTTTNDGLTAVNRYAPGHSSSKAILQTSKEALAALSQLEGFLEEVDKPTLNRDRTILKDGESTLQAIVDSMPTENFETFDSEVQPYMQDHGTNNTVSLNMGHLSKESD